jgi:hypothetical protein
VKSEIWNLESEIAAARAFEICHIVSPLTACFFETWNLPSQIALPRRYET